MGGCGFFAIFNIFKSKRYHRGDDYYAWDDSMKAYKAWPSDEDRGLWVAEPGIDRRAGDYIAKKHAATASSDQD
ncbi:hypothetical protein CsSME_00025262 [Camellia sinensis var. sinensis]